VRPSFAARWAAARLQTRVAPELAAAPNQAVARQILESAAPLPRRPAPAPAARAFGGICGDWFETSGADRILLYLHGGAFFAGSPELYRPLAGALAASGFHVFVPDYRLAPHPGPLDDARAVCAALMQTFGDIVIAGDSAGGGLAVSLMAALHADGERFPCRAALFSPWTDYAVTGASARENASRDALFSRQMLKIAGRAYLGGAGLAAASPLHADLSGLPPMLVHAGRDELLRDDATRLVDRARAAGVAAELTLWPGVPHGWQFAAEFMPEAQESIAQAAAFLAGA